MNRRTPITLTAGALALGLCLIAACDDSGEQRKDGAPGTQDGKANVPGDGKIPTSPELRKFKNPAEAITAYNTCYSDCFTQHTNATNRETCKLECDGLAEAGMDTLKTDPEKTKYKETWTTLRGCITGCWDDKKLNSTNRATCLLTCSDAAEIAAVPVPDGPGAAQPTTPVGTPPAVPPGATPPTTTPPTGSAPTKAPTPTTPTTPPAGATRTTPPTGAAPAKK